MKTATAKGKALLPPELRKAALELVRAGSAEVITEATHIRAVVTGFSADKRRNMARTFEEWAAQLRFTADLQDGKGLRENRLARN